MTDYNQFTPLRRLIDGDYAKAFRNTANIMISRPFSMREFEKVHATIKEFRRCGRVLTDWGALDDNLKALRIDVTSPYYYNAISYERIGDYYQIAHVRVIMHQLKYIVAVRTHPLFLKMSHIQGRHVRWDDRILDYGNAEFTGGIAISLLVSKAAETYLENLGEERAEMVLPATNGFYFGYCQREKPDSVDKGRTMMAFRDSKFGKIRETKPTWRPTVGMYMKTYLPAEVMDVEQRNVYQLFYDVMMMDSFADVAMCAFENYMRGSSLDYAIPDKADVKLIDAKKMREKFRTASPLIRPGQMDRIDASEDIRPSSLFEANGKNHALIMGRLRDVFEHKFWKGRFQRRAALAAEEGPSK